MLKLVVLNVVISTLLHYVTDNRENLPLKRTHVTIKQNVAISTTCMKTRNTAWIINNYWMRLSMIS